MVLVIPNISQEIIDVLFDKLRSERIELKYVALRLITALILRRFIKAGTNTFDLNTFRLGP
jgi:hypothetical protein